MSNTVGELAAMSSFLITCIFFAVQNVTRRVCLNLLAIGKLNQSQDQRAGTAAVNARGYNNVATRIL